jgi:2,4-dienoyl-CoA reductase-like NADH-dependent reductase (Old Yellow Enzyme family)
MDNKYTQLLKSITLPNGANLNNRIAMAPMTLSASNEDGSVSKSDLAFFDKRSDVAGLIITSATYINEIGRAGKVTLSVSKDEDIEGLKKLTNVIKKDGNKVVLQLAHAGRIADYGNLGRVVAPSVFKSHSLDYLPEELTEVEIEETIKDFGRATERAIKAGFDGVEIHGASHLLLQQFFSVNTNKRNDQWGGSLEKRKAFPLAVTKEIKRVVGESAKKDFIVGYRIAPEEIHGEDIGYTIKESLQLIDKLADEKIDYLHLSLNDGYDSAPNGSDKSYGQQIKEVINNRYPIIIGSNVFTADDALDALNHGDIVALARAALIETQFTRKIRENRANEIHTSVEDNLDHLALPENMLQIFLMENSPLPPLPGLEKVKKKI